MKKTLLILALIVFACAAVFAQGGPGGPGRGPGGPGRGPGGPGRGPGGPGRGPGMGMPGMMMGMPGGMMGGGYDFDVTYLGLNEEKTAKVKALVTKYENAQKEAMETMRKEMEAARAEGKDMRNANMFDQRAAKTAFEKELKGILSKEEASRYDNLMLKNTFFSQLGVYHPMVKTKLEDKLKLTEEQVKKIDQLLTKYQKPTQEINKEGEKLMESMRNAADREAAMKSMQAYMEKSNKNLSDFEVEYKTLLTMDQINAYNAYAKSLREEVQKIMQETMGQRGPQGGRGGGRGGERGPRPERPQAN
ncbi:MAG: hypothetical protein ILO36_03620 [Abditibacteriota bacterium]|nr:hypothetical protein [Abditibacteriota bacterium]